MKDWTEKDCRNCGRSMAVFSRMFQTGEDAVDAWIKNYPQVSILADEVEGLTAFMTVIANNLLRDNKFGMVFRVCISPWIAFASLFIFSVVSCWASRLAIFSLWVIISWSTSWNCFFLRSSSSALSLLNFVSQAPECLTGPRQSFRALQRILQWM